MFRRHLTGAIALVATLASAPPAFGQGADSQRILIPRAMDTRAVNPGYGILAPHILDPNEVDITAVPLPPGIRFIDPFGPLPDDGANVTGHYTHWEPDVCASGLHFLTSDRFSTLLLDIHARNAAIGNESGLDITLDFWDILHIRAGPTPGATDLTSGVDSQDDLFLRLMNSSWEIEWIPTGQAGH
jgi:hypothetical protein